MKLKHYKYYNINNDEKYNDITDDNNKDDDDTEETYYDGVNVSDSDAPTYFFSAFP